MEDAHFEKKAQEMIFYPAKEIFLNEEKFYTYLIDNSKLFSQLWINFSFSEL